MAAVPSPSPVRVRGTLQSDLGRWRWLYKWFLAIPHLVVLTLLWIAFVVLTVVAWVSIAVTGRYPRGIFDFNLGVMRWTWRVTFYAFTLASDEYPRFSLEAQPDDPAQLDIEYPEHLSRGLVWVKWLLGIPQFIVAGIFAGGANWGGGLIGILCLVAGVLLAVQRQYPASLFELVMGLHRWVWRVVAYGALMRDEYPPFRLDMGPDEPGVVPVGAPPSGAGPFAQPPPPPPPPGPLPA